MKTKMIVKKVTVLISMLMVLVSINGIGYAIVMEDGKDETKPPIIEERGGLVRPDEIKRQEPKYAPGEVLAKFKEGVDPSSILKEIGIEAKEINRIHSIKPAVAKFKKDYKLEKDSEGWYPFLGKNYKEIDQIPDEEMFKEAYSKMPDVEKALYRSYKVTLPEGMTVEEAVNKLKQDPNVEYAEPNYVVEIQMVPNDPYYSSAGSWGQPYDDLWGIKKLQCEQAWDISQGEGVVVAVIDTGVDYNHPDLAQNIWVNPGEDINNNGIVDDTDFDGIDNDNNGYVDDIRGWDFCTIGTAAEGYIKDPDNNPMDDNGHGTHVSGTIAAVGNNNTGVIGVAPEAKIMAVKGLSDGGSGYISDLAECVIYAADNGADILNNSWGGNGTSQFLADVFHYADSKGCLAIAAAGNSNQDASNHTPSNIDTVMSVAASNSSDEKSWFSNYGPDIDVAAPGSDVLSTFPIEMQAASKAKVIVNSDNDKNLQANILQYAAPIPEGGLSGEVLFADLGRLGDFIGLDVTGRIALIKRGVISFKDKVQNAYNAGAIGVIIYNNISGNFYGTLQTEAEIPAVSISMEDGEYLERLISTSETTVTLSEVDLGNYSVFNGTSMACPHAAGLAALIISKYPNFSNETVRDIILSSADDLGEPGKDDIFGYGRINAAKAVAGGAIYILYPLMNDYVHGRVEISGSVYLEEGFQRYELYYASKANPENITIITSSTTPVNDGILGIWDTAVCPNDGEYILTLKVIKNDSSEFTISKIVKVDNINEPPVFVNFNDKATFLGEETRFKIEARDPDDPRTPSGQLTYSANNLPSGAEFNPETQEFRWTRPPLDGGVYDVTFMAQDGVNTVESTVKLIPMEKKNIGYRDKFRIIDADIYQNKIVCAVDYDRDYDDLAGLYIYNLDTDTMRPVYHVDASVYPGAEIFLIYTKKSCIWGDKIAWLVSRDDFLPGYAYGVDHIYMSDLSTGEIRKVTSARVERLNLSIYGDKVVWEERHNRSISDSPYYEVLADHVYMHDFSTNSTTQVTTDDGYTLPRLPYIYGDKIFMVTDPGLYMYDTSTLQKTYLTDGSRMAGRLNAYENKIVWPEIQNLFATSWSEFNLDIYMYDITTQEKRQITTDSGNQLDAVIYGDKICYLAYSKTHSYGDDYAITMYDLSTNRNLDITIIGGASDTVFWSITHKIYDEELIWVLDNYIAFARFILPPKITSISSTELTTGGYFTIRGKCFGLYSEPNEAPQVIFSNSIPAIIKSHSMTEIVCQVPEGAQSGPLKVITIGGESNEVAISIVSADPTNQPPLLTPIGNKSVNEDTLLTFTVNAADPDNDPLTYMAQNLPDGAIFINQTFEWQPTYFQAGTYQVTFIVSDGQLQDEETVSITARNISQPLRLDYIGPKTVAEGKLLQFTVSASGPDGDILTYSTSNLPEGATFNPTTHVFSWRPDFTQADYISATTPGRYSVAFFVYDGGISSYERVSITVTQNDEAGITFPNKNNYHLRGTRNITGSASLEGDFQRYELYYAPEDNPQAMTLINSSSTPVTNGVLGVWDTTTCPDGKYILVLKVISTGGWEGKCPQVSAIVDNINNPPTLEKLTDQVSFLGKYVIFKVEATDLDDPATPWGKLTYSADNLPQGARFYPKSRIFSWRRPRTDGLTHTVTFRVSDSEYTVNKDIKLIPAEEMSILSFAGEIAPEGTILHGEKVFYKLYDYLPNGDAVESYYMYNLSTKRLQRLENYPEKASAVYDDRYVYSDFHDGHHGIFMHDFSTNQEKQISNTYEPPSIYGDKIVWRVNSYIFMYDISTEQEVSIPTSSYGLPIIYGDKIVLGWAGGSNPPSNSHIYMHDLSTNQERQITNDLRSDYNPVIYGDKIVFQRRDKIGNSKIDIVYMYDLSANQEVEIYASARYRSGPPLLYGDRIAWYDNSNYSSGIYMYDVPTHQIIQVANYSTGALSLYDDRLLFRKNLYDEDGNSAYTLDIIRFILPPQIASVEPLEPGIGTYFAIEGNYFGYTTEGAQVLFSNGITAPILDWSNRRIICQVPEGAQSGPLKVITIGGESNAADITIGSNNPPVLDLIGDKAVDEGALLEFAISAADPDRNYLIYSATSLPEGAIFNPDIKTFNWSPNHSQAGTYQVIFTVSDGALSDLEIVNITVSDAVPLINEPTNLTAIPISPTQIKLTWQDNSDNEDGFKIEQSHNGYVFEEISTTGANVRRYTVNDLTQGIYYFRVYAYNDIADSPYTNIATCNFIVPIAPSNLIAQGLSCTKIKLTWQDNSDNEKGFKVEMSDNGGMDFGYTFSVGANRTTYTVSELTETGTYLFRVSAYNVLGNSYSETIQATTLPLPVAPSNLTAQALSSTKIKLTWQDNSSDETGFKVEMSADGTTYVAKGSARADITTCTISKLTPNTTYYFRVYAYRGTDKSAYSEVVQGTTLPLPVAPSNLTTQALSSTKIKLIWQDNSSDETGFKVEMSTDGTTYVAKGSAKTDITTRTISKLTPNSTYHFRVYAYRGTDKSGYSEVVSGTTLPLPVAPSNLTATVLSSTQIKLTWQDNSSDETGFKVEMSADGTTYVAKGSARADITTCTISKLTPNTTYYFRVYAYRGTDKSAYSEVVQGTTLPLPVAPSNLTTQALSSTKIKLIWQDNSSDETGFKVEMSTDGTTYVAKGSAKADITTCTISKLTPNTTYYFRVYAYRGTDKSAYSEVVQGTTLPLPIAPSNLTATAISSTKLQLTWQDNSLDETGFKIEQSTDGITFAYKGYVTADKTTFTASGLTSGTTYYYRAYAYRGYDKSTYSNVASGTTQ